MGEGGMKFLSGSVSAAGGRGKTGGAGAESPGVSRNALK